MDATLASRGNWQSILGRYPFVPALIILIMLLVFNGMAEPNSLSFRSVNGLFKTYMALMFLAVAQTLVVSAADVDLSIGAILSLVNVTVVTTIGALGDGPLAIAAACLVGVFVGFLCGLLNGFVVAGLNLQPIVATFATGVLFTGIALWVLPVAGMPVPSAYWRLYGGSVLGIPFIYYILAGLGLAIFLISRTTLMVKILAVGDDQQGAFQSGLPVTRIRISAYAYCGVFSAFAALCITGDTASGDPLVGNAMTLYSIAAVVLGGTALSGGKASLLGASIGALTIGLINSLVFFVGTPSEWQNLVQGMSILVALMLGIFVSRRIEQ
ncbi:MAG: ABC transporter permease [Rhizobiaceae bacterium]